MITKNDLLEAIEKTQGQKNPNAATCIKLAAYYTILDHYDEDINYSFSNEPLSEFMRLSKRKRNSDVMLIMDDLMEKLQSSDPKMYYTVMDRLDRI